MRMPGAFWALAAGRFVSALGDGFFFPFIAMFLQQVHRLPPEQVGVIMSTAGVGSLLARLPAGWLTDRLGFKPVVVGGLAGAGLAVVAAGWAPSPWAFALCYAAMSAMVWGSFPALLHGAALLVPPRRREEAYSILNLLSNAAIAVGPVLGTYVVDRDIRLIFLLDGVSFLVFAAVVARWVPARREGGRSRRHGHRVPGRTRPPAAPRARRWAAGGGAGGRCARWRASSRPWGTGPSGSWRWAPWP